MMQAYTEEQRTELVQFNRAVIAQHEAYAVPETLWPVEVRLMVSSARIALAALTAEVHSYTFEEDPQPLYTAPHITVTAIPSGWKLVPVEPTERMVINGFESAPTLLFSKPDEWVAYEAMSGCQQAAHLTRLCWAAMLAAAPEVE